MDSLVMSGLILLLPLVAVVVLIHSLFRAGWLGKCCLLGMLLLGALEVKSLLSSPYQLQRQYSQVVLTAAP